MIPAADEGVARSLRYFVIRRAVLLASLVGTALVLINHGDHILDEPMCQHFALKAGLSYLVPFLVSMTSTILAQRDHRSQAPAGPPVRPPPP